jgi:hypothetical protein
MEVKMKTIFALLVLIFFLVSCDSDGDRTPQNGPNAKLVSYTECKSGEFFLSIETGDEITSSDDCIKYEWDGAGQLKLKHINAAFNCCPGKLSADIKIETGEITIFETEEAAGCHCNCLYDLEYLITGLEAGEYKIKVVEPYKPDGDEAIEFTIVLSQDVIESYFCTSRSGYPWGLID